MEIPKFLKDKIDEDTKLAGIVNTAISKTRNIINKAQPDFFPEYTDHGPDHNTDVLASAVDLMTKKTSEIFSPSDAAALTLAVLLHDCGMHLTPDGFKTLIASDYRGVDGLDNTTWLELWNDYMMQARRYDERTLIDIFGDAHPIGDDPVNKQPIDLTVRDKMLIGDFLRRHHPRLAHEIALNGFPGVEGNIALFDDSCDVDICSAWGMIARSHGMALRQANDEFARMFDRYEFRNIHGCYLMVLLRIADLMQIQAERAPEGVFQIKKLKSPFSHGEWKVHQSISNLTRAGSDPEAISIKAEPESVEIFLKVKGWTDYLQTELDQSWAVLGEEYGRQDDPPLKNLQLKLRRVKTNFDDIKKFGENVDYVPRKIAFDTNNPDLLNLLVGPLYDERPEIGIRELMQNAVDAVRERTEIEGKRPTELINGKDDDVSICIDGDEERGMTVTISDRGIGMNLDVIENYFLKAGSSFRNSATWKKDFQDDEGKSKIERSGRFGIGALAVFLIGRKAIVRTRRCGEDHGYEFVAELGKSALTIRPAICPVGTEIIITLDETDNSLENLILNSDFYIDDWPSVRRYQQDQKIATKFNRFEQSVGGEFVKVEQDRYEQVLWSNTRLKFSTKSSNYASINTIFCNGIYISDTEKLDFWKGLPADLGIQDQNGAFRFSRQSVLETPGLLIIDKDGIFPLNLRRDGLASNDKDLCISLAKSILENLISEIIGKAPEHHLSDVISGNIGSEKLTAVSFDNHCLGFSDKHNNRIDWIWQDGFWTIPLDHFSSKLLQSNLQLFGTVENENFLFSPVKHSRISWITNSDFMDSAEIISELGSLIGNFETLELCISETLYERIMFEFERDDVAFDIYHLQDLMDFMHSYSEMGGINGYLVFSPVKLSQSPRKAFYEALCSEDTFEPIRCIFGINESPSPGIFSSEGFFLQRWRELCGDGVIPVKWEDRITAFPKAFEVLGDRIEYHRAQKLKAEKKDPKS